MAISWDPVPGAMQYRIYWSELPGEDKQLIHAVDADAPQPFIDFGRSVEVGKDCYEISASLEGGSEEGPPSGEVCFEP